MRLDIPLRIDLRRLGELDVAERFAHRLPPLATQFIFGLACALAYVVVRLGVDSVAPGAGPYALIFPVIMIATLFGGWVAGLGAFAATFLYAWYFELPPRDSFEFLNLPDQRRTVVSAAAALAIVAFAGVFRSAVQRVVDERDSEIHSCNRLLTEVDHLMKNNFAITAHLLRIQMRTASEGGREALQVAIARIHSFAAAHHALYRRQVGFLQVDMKRYLETLAAHLRSTCADNSVLLSASAEPVFLPRERAVSIGLVVNELIANAVKHAFPDGERALIDVDFRVVEGGWRLVVADNGRRMASDNAENDVGSGLIAAFADGAGGDVAIENSPNGTRATMTQNISRDAQEGEDRQDRARTAGAL